VPELSDAAPRATAQIHPVTAAEFGISDGAEMIVTSARGELVCNAEHTVRVRPDTIFVPFHFPGSASANRLTPAAADPISGMPEFKTSRVSIARSDGAS
jgi:assimilatory nitrate reductase catalytic subunit